MCRALVPLKPSVPSGWRAIKAENKLYYFCDMCQPSCKDKENWAHFYKTAIGKIYDADFRRPIKKLLILADEGAETTILYNLKDVSKQ